MKVEILQNFSSTAGSFVVGDKPDLPDEMAKEYSRIGYARKADERATKKPKKETATKR